MSAPDPSPIYLHNMNKIDHCDLYRAPQMQFNTRSVAPTQEGNIDQIDGTFQHGIAAIWLGLCWELV